MPSKSLRSQLNQIRAWVRQGRTDAWIAHQLDVSVGELVGFKREHDLAPPAEGDDGPPFGGDEEDLRAQDDALVAAALDAEPEEEEETEPEAEEDGGDKSAETGAPRRRRGRRGGSGRRGGGRARPLEGTFDHGEEGYGLWLDPAIQDDATYAEHWAGHRPVTIAVERDRIVIRRAGEADGDDADGSDD